MRMRKKPNLIPRMERCAAVQIRTPEDHKGRWAEEFSQYREIRLELGCGKGRFTCEQALREPDVLLLALEKVPDAMVVAMERVVEQGIPNVRFLDRDAELLPEMFAPGEISRLYINFPDPWPKKKQFKRLCLTAPEFLDKYRALLPEGGAVWFKTRQRAAFRLVARIVPRLRLGACRYAGGHAHDRLRSALHRDGPSHPPRCGDAPIGPYGKNRKRGQLAGRLFLAPMAGCDGRLIPAPLPGTRRSARHEPKRSPPRRSCIRTARRKRCSSGPRGIRPSPCRSSAATPRAWRRPRAR